MDEGQKAAAMWSLGFGDSNETQLGKAPEPPRTRVLASDWKTERMPFRNVEVDLCLQLTNDEFETLALGHRPEVMEDHWFMFFDGRSFNFHRSWTGFCIYQVHVERAHDDRDGYVLTGATVNRCKAQYSETSDERDRLIVEILVLQALGKDVSRQWEAYFSLRVPEAGARDSHPASPLGFWKADGPYGCLSNWHHAGFDFRGMHFATSEHWMMWQKARVLGDDAMAGRILAANTPDGAKYLGGKASPFHKVWDDVREQMVYYGVREKFLQNEPERAMLLSTGSAILAEASPVDPIWGVGMADNDPDFTNPAKWKGDNLQGRVCMRVRADIRQLQAMERLDDLSDTFAEPSDGISHMTLLQLARIPSTRTAIYCYAQIVSHAMHYKYPTPGYFLKKECDLTIGGVSQAMDDNAKGGLPVAGWYELVRELVVQQALQRL